MAIKAEKKEFSDKELKEELKEIKSWKSKEPKDLRLVEIARHYASRNEWESSLEAAQLITNEKERNLLLADIIEGFLLPNSQIVEAKKFAKYLTPVAEIEPFVWIRIALAEDDTDQAQRIAEHLPSPLSRNFAYMHIMESLLTRMEKGKVVELSKLMTENIRTIYDNKTRCFILRELALNLFLAFRDKERAKEMANLIPDEAIKNQVLNKIENPK